MKNTAMIHVYILGCIDGDGYGVELHTDLARINFLLETFHKEKDCEIKRSGEVKAFKEWVQGLPSAFKVDLENYRILELGHEWGLLPDNPTERQEDVFIEQYWDRLYMNVQAIKKEVYKRYNVEPKMTIYEIARRTQATSPHYFTRDTLRFFHQKMSDFKVKKQKDGKYLISAPMKDHTGREVGISQRLFNPITNELEHI